MTWLQPTWTWSAVAPGTPVVAGRTRFAAHAPNNPHGNKRSASRRTSTGAQENRGRGDWCDGKGTYNPPRVLTSMEYCMALRSTRSLSTTSAATVTLTVKPQLGLVMKPTMGRVFGPAM